MGSIIAYSQNKFMLEIAVLATATTVFLQILSNLANDYGDSKKGTDNANRVGPERAVQSGAISLREMKNGIIISSLLSLLSGIALIYIGLKDCNLAYLVLFFVLGIASIAAAIKYTLGKNPYGYAGLGDLFVFLFFGIIGVIGTYFLHTHNFELVLVLPATTIGLLSASVLNMNNMRDIKNDAESNKKTLVVKLGIRKSKTYHTMLILGAIISFTTYLILKESSYTFLICTIPLPILILNLKKVWSFKDNRELDPELKKLALSTFLLTLLFGISSIL
jgi:1,4-dihydroxy-2-naphthoate polyprenyltransferase